MRTFPAAAAAWRAGEEGLAVAALAAMALLPVTEATLRSAFGAGLPGAFAYTQNLSLWVGFLGAVIAAREGRHLSITSLAARAQNGAGAPIAILRAATTTSVLTGLFWACFLFVTAESGSGETIGSGLPVWIVEAVLPVSMAAILLHVIRRETHSATRLAAFAGIAICVAIGHLPGAGQAALPLLVAVSVLAVVLGAPIFVALGGASLALFFAEGVPVSAIPAEAYRVVTSPTIPAIPLFTLTGYVLAESRASVRLVRLFRALLGFLPGGAPVAVTLICAFFATFTGASGVTILALGGLLLPVLLNSGYGERFSIGLLTATGSIGLLFPPSLAVILYAVIARIPITDLFLAALIPGLILVGTVCAYGVWAGRNRAHSHQPFDRTEALAALRAAKWELLLPLIVVVGVFGGFLTLIEAAAVSACYAIVVVTVLHRDLNPLRDLPRIFVESSALIGGVFMILGVALGFTNYLVDAQVPALAAAWVRERIDSPLHFLIFLNLFLLIVGCLMDIFSAIVVVVPLLLPIALAFGIDPLHLGIIFLVNLELGYLTPPVGMNLFLSAYRFDRPVPEICRAVLPFLLVLLGVVGLVTYLPALSLVLVR